MESKFTELTADEVKAMYFHPEALLEAPRKLFRLDYRGDRYYYYFKEDGKPKFCRSITSMLSKQMPTPQNLIEWIANKGIQEAELYKVDRGNYGTFLHKEVADLMIAGSYDLDQLYVRLLDYCVKQNLPSSFARANNEELKKDMLSFAQFFKDYNIRPIAIELPLISESMNLGCTTDLICEMNDKLYVDMPEENRKRCIAVVDFKGGRKGFGPNHELQLEACRRAFHENFPKHEPITKLFNWSPKDWRSDPTYNLKDQTKSKNIQKLNALIELNNIDEEGKTGGVTVTEGIITLNKPLLGTYYSTSYEDIVRKKNGVVIPEEPIATQPEPVKPKKLTIS